MLTLATMSNNVSTIVFSDYFPEKKCNKDVSVKQVMSIRLTYYREYILRNCSIPSICEIAIATDTYTIT